MRRGRIFKYSAFLEQCWISFFLKKGIIMWWRASISPLSCESFNIFSYFVKVIKKYLHSKQCVSKPSKIICLYLLVLNNHTSTYSVIGNYAQIDVDHFYILGKYNFSIKWIIHWVQVGSGMYHHITPILTGKGMVLF